MASIFRFKEFEVNQDQCAMKIGTDAVLLGAWINLNTYLYNSLDIGAGTGIIALQLAQRSSAQEIDALEVNDQAYEQCVENFENSPWNDRLFCYHASLQEFVDEMDVTYNLIVSNPPFYEQTAKAINARNQARFTQHLSFQDLLFGVNQLLDEAGIFACVIPFQEQSKFIKLAKENNLFLHRICKVRGQPTSEFKRCLMEFKKHKPKQLQEEELTIELSRHNYTQEYINLTKDFYLKM